MQLSSRLGARVAVPAALSLFAAAAVAQVGTRGALAGAPVAILVDGGVTAGGDAETRIHRSGFSLAPTVALPASSTSADIRTILAAHGAPPGIDVDDFSTGRDDVLIDTNGWLAVPSMSWAVLSFSMRTGATGIPAIGSQPPSRIWQQAAEGDVGAALFSWILPGSNVPATLVGPGVVERSHSRAELGVPGGPVTTEVDGVDVSLMLGLDQVGLATREPGFAAFIETPEALYFTVSHATRDLIPPAWWLFNGQPTLSSGASIFRTARIIGGWSTPAVMQPYSLLGLQRDEDIDGLAYDRMRDRLLFSTVGPLRDQFLFLDFITDSSGAPREVKLADGVTKVSESIGKAQNDDVDAICTLDPLLGTVGTPPAGGEEFGSSCGTPAPAGLSTPAIHASAFRRYAGTTVHYDSWMMGWPPITGQQIGFAAMFLTIGSSPDLHLFSPVFIRNPGNPITGDPLQGSFVVPTSLALTNFEVTVRWFAADVALTEIAEAWPVRLFL